MPDVELTEEAYLLLEKWYGMLFAQDVEVKQKKSSDKDKMLFQKLSVMHIALIQDRLDIQNDKESEKDE